MTNSKMKKGFTLIEVVIVLAIAALIMVVVFFAVTGAQRGQRNDARQQLAARVLAGMATARGNNNGTLTFSGSGSNDFVTNYASYVNNMNVGSTTYTVAAASTAQASGTTGCTVGTTIEVGSTSGKDYAQVCTESAGSGGVWYVASN